MMHVDIDFGVLRARLTDLISDHDELLDRALVVRGQIIELQQFMTALAGSDKNTATSEGQ